MIASTPATKYCSFVINYHELLKSMSWWWFAIHYDPGKNTLSIYVESVAHITNVFTISSGVLENKMSVTLQENIKWKTCTMAIFCLRFKMLIRKDTDRRWQMQLKPCSSFHESNPRILKKKSFQWEVYESLLLMQLDSFNGINFLLMAYSR